MAKKENKRTIPCSVQDCTGKVGELSITGLCPRCYASLYNWLNKHTAKDRVQRALQLNLWANRLCYLLPDDKIQLLTTRKRYQPLTVLPGKVKAYRKRTKYKVMKS